MIVTRSCLYGLLFAVLPATATRAGEIYERPWIEAKSPNFVIRSALGPKFTVKAAQELEDFRQLVALITTIGTVRERVPTYVYLFPDAEESVALSGDIYGRFIPLMRANLASARGSANSRLTWVLQHEYAHFLLHSRDGQSYPRWFDEGFAEFISTADIEGGKFGFGDVDKGRAYTLMSGPWLSFEKVLDEEKSFELSKRQTSMFYAQSWALAHYLMMGPGGSTFGAKNTQYLRLMEKGEAPVAAFEQAFGETVDHLTTTLRIYFKRMKMMTGHLRNPFPESQVTVRTLPPDQLAAALGEMALVVGRMDDSARYYQAALKLNPGNSDALVGAADHLKFAEKYAEAEPMYRRALEIRPDNDLHHLDFGEYWLDRADDATDAGEKQRLVALARQELVAAFKLNEKNPETLAIYGSSYIDRDSDVKKGLDTLELANQLLPSNPTIKYLLAKMYIALGRPSDARPLLLTVVAWSHNGGATPARKLLASIDPAVSVPESEGSEAGETDSGGDEPGAGTDETQ